MASEGRSIMEAIRHNRGLKVAALAGAVVLWYAIREVTSFEAKVQGVQLDVLLDPGWAVLDRSIDEVDVLFRGSPSDIRYLNRDQIRVEVDLRGQSVAGSRDVRLGPRKVRAPGGVRAISVDPSEITLSLDREGAREVAVKADIVGNTPDGFEVESVVCTPGQVRLQGPEGRLAGIAEAKTGPIDLEGRLRSFTLTRTVLSPSETWSARVEPDRVRVDVKIVERSTRKEVEGVPVQLVVRPDTPPINLVAEARVKLSLKGRSEILSGLEATNLSAYVDCTALQPGEVREVTIFAPVPNGVELLGVEPAQLRVEMRGP
jgi:YbbR domain-containing protein